MLSLLERREDPSMSVRSFNQQIWDLCPPVLPYTCDTDGQIIQLTIGVNTYF